MSKCPKCGQYVNDLGAMGGSGTATVLSDIWVTVQGLYGWYAYRRWVVCLSCIQ